MKGNTFEDTSMRQVLVIRMKLDHKNTVKNLKWVFRRWKPYVYQTYIANPRIADGSKEVCECFVVFRDSTDLREGILVHYFVQSALQLRDDFSAFICSFRNKI